MSTKSSQKGKKQQSADSKAQLVKSHTQGPFAGVADHILPGVTPVQERVVEVRKQTAGFSGPIPHPEIFRKYGDVIPDAPERILRVFEEDSKHVRDIEMAALVAQRSDNRRVHWMAWSLIVGGYVLGFTFALLDKDVLAGAVLTTTLAGTIAGFFQTRQEERQQDKEK